MDTLLNVGMSRPPIFLSNVRSTTLHIWCRECGHRGEVDGDTLIDRYGPDADQWATVLRLPCGECGWREVKAQEPQRPEVRMIPKSGAKAGYRGFP